MADEKPKHKPSPKRTLEEVLKSLQDLIRNDLVSRRDAHAPPVSPPAPPTASIPDTFDQALDKLDELITHELVEPARRASEMAQSEPEDPLPGEAEWPLEDEAEAREENRIAPPTAEAQARADAPPPGEAETPATKSEEPRFGIQDVLPFEEPPTPSLASFLKDAEPGARAPETSPAETAQTSAPEPRPGAPPADSGPATAPEMREQTAGETAAAAREEAASPALDDGIPVLHEVVADLEAGHALATPEKAREIAIRVVARLNIERRKAGEAPLDIRTIERLQKLLKDALARGEPPTGD